MNRFLSTMVMLAATLVVSTAHAANVVYPDGERQQAPDAIFLDRAGDLYPPFGVPVDTAAMLTLDPDVGAVAPLEVVTLRGMYRWQASTGEPGWKKLLAHAQVEGSGDFDRDWEAVQDALRRMVVKQLNAQKGTDVLLVVHGFNNDFRGANKWLVPFEKAVLEAYPQVRSTRVYWDGLLGNDAGIGIWGEAQYNGPRVGQQLRRVLNQLDADLRVRIFTHSSGAYVVTNALGDGSHSYRGFEGSVQLKERAGALDGAYAVPRNITDLRVAMLIPAQPLSAFDGFAQGTKGVVPTRLILGTSPRDKAATKLGVSCAIGGNTCMAVRTAEAFQWSRKALAPRAGQLMVIGFPAPATGHHEHGVEWYMEDREQWQALLGQLLGDASGCPASGKTWCQASDGKELAAR